MTPPTITFEGREVQPLEQESVLDALIRAGIPVSFSCKGGVCHTCMLQCVDGDIPATAQRSLNDELRGKGYFLPCKCIATSSMQLRPKQPQDMLTRCMLIEVSGHETGSLKILFEPLGRFDYRAEQTVHLLTGGDSEPVLQLTSAPDSPAVEARWVLRPSEICPDWLTPDAEFGFEFEVRGPFNAGYDDVLEMPFPEPDPELWAALDDGVLARRVLEDFYARVYADELLAPFFQDVPIEHIIGQQYAFLERCVTGNKVYWGETPRNTHHWMVIPHSVFDHRQRLMETTQRDHGMSEALMRRWNRFEEYFRSDIVKDHPWPKRFGDAVVDLEGFDHLALDCGTLCDSCNAAVATGTVVTYHRRTGRISCPACNPQ